MRAAFAIWDGRMAPVFDVSREAVVMSIREGAVESRTREGIEASTATRKIERLVELGVQTLVCGAISEQLQHDLTVRGVKVIGFVAGELDDVVRSFLAGRLPSPELSMPGCCGRQRRCRGGRGRNGKLGGDCGRNRRP